MGGWSFGFSRRFFEVKLSFIKDFRFFNLVEYIFQFVYLLLLLVMVIEKVVSLDINSRYIKEIQIFIENMLLWLILILLSWLEFWFTESLLLCFGNKILDLRIFILRWDLSLVIALLFELSFYGWLKSGFFGGCYIAVTIFMRKNLRLEDLVYFIIGRFRFERFILYGSTNLIQISLGRG